MPWMAACGSRRKCDRSEDWGESVKIFSEINREGTQTSPTARRSSGPMRRLPQSDLQTSAVSLTCQDTQCLDKPQTLLRTGSRMRITSIRTRDIPFPTSREMDGSDAMNPDPDYS